MEIVCMLDVYCLVCLDYVHFTWTHYGEGVRRQLISICGPQRRARHEQTESSFERHTHHPQSHFETIVFVVCNLRNPRHLIWPPDPVDWIRIVRQEGDVMWGWKVKHCISVLCVCGANCLILRHYFIDGPYLVARIHWLDFQLKPTIIRDGPPSMSVSNKAKFDHV